MVLERTGRIKLPGFGLPVNTMGDEFSKWDSEKRVHPRNRFPNVIMDREANPVTVRERLMTYFINTTTDKPEWDWKVFDEEIVNRWRNEALFPDTGYFSEQMFDYCIAELRDKAKRFETTNTIPVFDTDAAVIKTDTTIPSELVQALKDAVRPLENISEHHRDWLQWSDKKVLDLVHPSLFPLIYGRTRVLPTGTVGLENCIESCGKGDIIGVPAEEEPQSRPWHHSYWSTRYQWLPCDVKFIEGDAVRITSYINNLHPVTHAKLYSVLEKIIQRVVPLWNETLSWYDCFSRLRINVQDCEFTHAEKQDKAAADMANPSTKARTSPMKEHDEDKEEEEGDEDIDGENSDEGMNSEDSEDERRRTRIVFQPEPRPYTPIAAKPHRTPISLSQDFQASGIQIFVKLTNIHLTPEKPTYDGGVWHTEDQLNERICASALYYYDQDNITNSMLEFRQMVFDEDIMGDDAYKKEGYVDVEDIFDVGLGRPCPQEIGRILTREGRLITFQNVLQCRVAPFELIDESKPGHCKILALFLVDPNMRILSTANVPPQQKQWWADAIVQGNERLGKLPPKLMAQVVDGVDDFPISLEEAKEIREQLRRAVISVSDSDGKSRA
ncbi:hypothetical protein V2W45_1355942 [Cenococcum geophilum]